jgi:hypothetical protein
VVILVGWSAIAPSGPRQRVNHAIIPTDACDDRSVTPPPRHGRA